MSIDMTASESKYGDNRRWDDDTEIGSRRLRLKSTERHRTILVSNPGSPEFQDRFADIIREEGLEDHVEYSVQVGARLNGRESYPDRIDVDKYDIQRVYDLSMENQSRNLKKPIGFFYDYEPEYRDIFGIKRSWSGRTRYTADDLSFFSRVFDVLRESGIPCSNFAVPRVPIGKRMNLFRIRDLQTATPIVQLSDHVQLRIYPRTRTDAEITPGAEINHRKAVRQHVEVYQKAFPLHPIVPIMFARHAFVDNYRFFSIYLDELDKVPEIDTIQYWTNTHNQTIFDFCSAQFRIVAPLLRAWVHRELIPA